ncbi:MAG TPA: hypothetical protein ENG36_00990 [Lentisphaerae bacterium]|nr:hypothetical protein [Lentisphaerota bacterium]
MRIRLHWVMGVLMACMLPAAQAELLNASFEESSDEEDWFSDQAKHWGRWGNWINRETGWTPTHSGDCLIGYHHWRIEEKTTSGIYQDVEGTPAGSECTFSVYVYKDPGTNCEYVELRLEPKGGGNAIASQFYKMSDLPKGKWKLISVTGRNEAEGLRVLIIVKPHQEGKREGAIKFDDASLECSQ